jgi:uncharacterized protein YjiS (DUF1127 family)
MEQMVMPGLQHISNRGIGSTLARSGVVLVRAMANGLRRIVVAIDAMHTRHRSRVYLQSLDDRMLKDLGLSRADVVRESSKPFWRG